MKEAGAGHGVDRHLMALRVMLQPNETMPSVFDDVYRRSCDFVLSTSNVSMVTFLIRHCCCCLIHYSIKNNSVRRGVHCLHPLLLMVMDGIEKY